VQAAVRAALLDAFSFAKRSFGQPVNEAEIVVLAQGVPGVVAADVALLADENGNVNTTAIEAHVARFEPFDAQHPSQGVVKPADLLLIDPLHLQIEDLVE